MIFKYGYANSKSRCECLSCMSVRCVIASSKKFLVPKYFNKTYDAFQVFKIEGLCQKQRCKLPVINAHRYSPWIFATMWRSVHAAQETINTAGARHGNK